MAGFGENLRREREARGVSLEGISSATKISVRLLQAIEDEDFDRLPGGVFNVNFVRQYARHLGLEEEEIISEYRRLTAPPPEPTTPQKVVPSEWVSGSDYEWDRQRQSQIWKFAGFVVLTVGLVGALYVWWSGRKTTVEPAPAVAEAPAPAPVSSAAQPPPAESRTPEAPPPAPTEPQPARPSRQAPSPTTAPPTPAGPATPAAPGEALVRVDIQANETVWVAASTDGMPRFQTTLEPQQTRTVTAQSSVRLRLGNAGGVTLLLNGVPQPAAGPKGQVRTVVFTPEGMQVVAPKPPEEGAPPASEETARPEPKKKTDSPDTPNRG